jgi:hypothetical protein
MSERGAGGEFLEEFRGFLLFLGSLWGLLAGVSVLFPLSNVLLEVIPLGAYGQEGGVYDLLSPRLVTTTSTLVTLFLLLAMFAGRERFRQRQVRRGVVRRAWITLLAGLLCLVAYLVLHRVYREYAWPVWGLGSGDPRKLLAEVPLAVAYVAFFALTTRAFVLLAMLEYLGEGGRRPPAA